MARWRLSNRAFRSCSCSAMMKVATPPNRAINFVKQRTDNVIVIDYAEISQGLHPWLAPFLMFVPMGGSATTCLFTKITTRMNAAITVVWWNINPLLARQRAEFTQGVTR